MNANWIHIDQAKRGRIQAIRRENERLIKLLTDLGAIRPNMFWPECYVIYTENGPIDKRMIDLVPCLKPIEDCNCIDCKESTNG